MSPIAPRTRLARVQDSPAGASAGGLVDPASSAFHRRNAATARVTGRLVAIAPDRADEPLRLAAAARHTGPAVVEGAARVRSRAPIRRPHGARS